MDLAQAFISQLKATAGITALTSNRIYPLVASQTVVKPYITYQQVSNPPYHAMSADPKIFSPRYQVDVWSTSYSGMVSVSTQVKTALRDRVGSLGSSNFKVQRIFFDGEIDIREINPETQAVTYHRLQDYIIWTTG